MPVLPTTSPLLLLIAKSGQTRHPDGPAIVPKAQLPSGPLLGAACSLRPTRSGWQLDEIGGSHSKDSVGRLTDVWKEKTRRRFRSDEASGCTAVVRDKRNDQLDDVGAPRVNVIASRLKDSEVLNRDAVA